VNAVFKIESTKAKSGFAALPRQAKSRDVAITRHGQVQAYVLSPERYDHLSSIARIGEDVMQKLDNEFDALVARMQTPAHRRAVERIASEPLSTILASGALAKPARKIRARKKSA
jgi:PHD/YefM family antitoxin component YafN of YafNO toxin-antitoxin module